LQKRWPDRGERCKNVRARTVSEEFLRSSSVNGHRRRSDSGHGKPVRPRDHDCWNGGLTRSPILSHCDWIALLAVIDDYAHCSSALRVSYLGTKAASPSSDEGNLTGKASAYRGASVGGTSLHISGCHGWNKVGELAYCSSECADAGYCDGDADEVWIGRGTYGYDLVS